LSYARTLRCRKCGREYPLEALNLCDFCLSPLEVAYDYKSIAKVISRERITQGHPGMWRYRDLLPVEGDVVDIGTGFTPLVKADNLGHDQGHRI
jgi:threonine synthase